MVRVKDIVSIGCGNPEMWPIHLFQALGHPNARGMGSKRVMSDSMEMTTKLRMCSRLAALAGAVLVCGSTALAQMGNGGGMGQQPMPQANSPDQMQMNTMHNANQPSVEDRMFVQNGSEAGLAQVAMAKIALAKSNNDRVKQFAQRMITDHTKLDQQVASVAGQNGVSPATQPSKKDRAMAAKLDALSEPQFDQEYIREMVKTHKQALSLFQDESSNGQDQAIRNAAAQGIPDITAHLQLAEQMAKDQNVNLKAK